MADKQGYYWDHEQCAWVPSPTRARTVEVPAQQTGVERDQEADVRSG